MSRSFLLLLAVIISTTTASRKISSDTFQSLDSSSSTWTVSNGSLSFPASIPGDLITDLSRGGVLGDPLYELNFKRTDWDESTWNYSTTFTLDASFSSSSAVWVVFDGIKMVSDISLNGIALGYTQDQFLRYTFDITTALTKGGSNTLVVSFPTGKDQRNSEQRWMSCSGGWDWAPYSSTSSCGASTFSKGIWHSVYLIGINSNSAAIMSVSPLVFYQGQYPTVPLLDNDHGDFKVNVVVHLFAPAATSGTVSVTGEWTDGTASLPVSLPAGDSNVTVTVFAKNNAVKLWWPSMTPGGLLPNLYNLSISFQENGGVAKLDSRRIGFRVFVLVTANDTDPSSIEGLDGQDGFTMRFKVNGADIWARGGNMIPTDELEGRYSDETHRLLVQSAASAGFNTFRLWGGGIFMIDAWYDACDELGILIYHDLMYAQGNHAPKVTPTQDAEIRYQIRRLSEHASIGLWDGCNECNGHGIYADFVMSTVAAEDPARPPWPSCPSNGWSSGVDRLWSLPNGSPLGLQPRLSSEVTSDTFTNTDTCTFLAHADFAQGTIGPLPSLDASSAAECCSICASYSDPKLGKCFAATLAGNVCWLKNESQSLMLDYNSGTTGCWPSGSGPAPSPPSPAPINPPGTVTCQGVGYETHGYYQHGEGIKTVNSGASLQPFPLNNPPVFPQIALTGTNVCKGTFASEFGGVAISSFESLSPTLDPSHWALHANPMTERNYAVDNFVTAIANLSWPSAFNTTGETNFKGMLYFAMLAQALWVKSDIESRRTQNNFGICTWQFNEIWPTGGWGSIEYGTVGFTPGQVIGGRWKSLQYFMRRYLYKNAMIAASTAARIFFRNDDAFSPLVGTATLSFLNIGTGQTTLVSSYPVNLAQGAAVSSWACANASVNVITTACPGWPSLLSANNCATDGSDCIALLAIHNSAGDVIVDNFELLTDPFAMTLPAANVTFSIGATSPDGTVPITLSTDKTALFVTMTTLAQGRFSDNAIFMSPEQPTIVSFIPWAPLDSALLASSLRVEHLATYPMNV